MSRNRPVSLALVGLFLWVTGCTSYRQIEIGEVADHGKVRVTLADGERETLHDPRVDRDSIRGNVGSRHDAEAIPLEQVVLVESRSTDVAGTVFIALGISVLVVGIVVGATADYGVGLGDWSSVE